MIAIVNKKATNKKGETFYFLQINDKFLTGFWHKREKGLAACLRSAADTYEKNRSVIESGIMKELFNEVTSEFESS